MADKVGHSVNETSGWTRLRSREIRGERTPAYGFGCGFAVASILIALFVAGASGIDLSGAAVIGCGITAIGWLLIRTGRDLIWNPPPAVFLSHPSITVGGGAELRWSVPHQRGISDIRIRWLGREIAVLHGYDSEWFTEVFREEAIASGDAATEGRHEIQVRADVMPSFRCRSAWIVWSVRFEFETDFFGRIERDYPIEVVPARP